MICPSQSFSSDLLDNVCTFVPYSPLPFFANRTEYYPKELFFGSLLLDVTSDAVIVYSFWQFYQEKITITFHSR
uniref:Uncharacterized protein n=1 Tax=Megaselia scalaris TaxID=36166 RepID=T1GB59_MEGSC